MSFGSCYWKSTDISWSSWMSRIWKVPKVTLCQNWGSHAFFSPSRIVTLLGISPFFFWNVWVTFRVYRQVETLGLYLFNDSLLVTKQTTKHLAFEREVEHNYRFDTCTSLARLRLADIPESKCEFSHAVSGRSSVAARGTDQSRTLLAGSKSNKKIDIQKPVCLTVQNWDMMSSQGQWAPPAPPRTLSSPSELSFCLLRHQSSRGYFHLTEVFETFCRRSKCVQNVHTPKRMDLCCRHERGETQLGHSAGADNQSGEWCKVNEDLWRQTVVLNASIHRLHIAVTWFRPIQCLVLYYHLSTCRYGKDNKLYFAIFCDRMRVVKKPNFCTWRQHIYHSC